jgi:hypothetical protein
MYVICIFIACKSRASTELRLAGVARLIGPDGKWSVVVNKVHTAMYSVCTLHILVCTCIYHVRLEIVMLEGVECSSRLTVPGWCILQSYTNSLQAGCCQNSIEDWKLYIRVSQCMYHVHAYIYIHKHVCTYTWIYINSCTCTYMLLQSCTYTYSL